jgi:hypothetical protein
LLHDLLEAIFSPIHVMLELTEHSPYRNRRTGLSLEPVVDKDVDPRSLDAWPELEEVGKLRLDAAHGGARPDADFGLRCLGGAMALQWIQRVRLLAELGISDADACSIVADNLQYSWDLQTLRRWNEELGETSES